MKKRLYKFIGIGFLLLAALPYEMGCRDSMEDQQAVQHKKLDEKKNTKETNEKDLDSHFWHILLK